MVEDELRNELRGAGLEPTEQFRARMSQEFDDALAGRRVLGVTAPSPRSPRRAPWMWPVIGAAAAIIAVAVVVTVGDGGDTVTPVATTDVTTDVTTEPTTVPTTVPTVPGEGAQMDVLTATLYGLRVGDVVDVEATIARIDALAFGPHTFDSGWFHVPNDSTIDSCYDDMDYRGVMWGDVLIVFNGTDASAEVMRWNVGEQDQPQALFFLGTELPTVERPNDVVSPEGIRIGSDATALQPPEFAEPGDRGDGVTVHGVAGIAPQDGSLPQPFVYVYARDGEVFSILADVGRC